MPINKDLISKSNEALARLPISDHRLGELPVEVSQLDAAAEAARPAVDFDIEPTRFVTVLHSFAESADHE